MALFRGDIGGLAKAVNVRVNAANVLTSYRGALTSKRVTELTS